MKLVFAALRERKHLRRYRVRASIFNTFLKLFWVLMYPNASVQYMATLYISARVLR